MLKKILITMGITVSLVGLSVEETKMEAYAASNETVLDFNEDEKKQSIIAKQTEGSAGYRGLINNTFGPSENQSTGVYKHKNDRITIYVDEQTDQVSMPTYRITPIVLNTHTEATSKAVVLKKGENTIENDQEGIIHIQNISEKTKQEGLALSITGGEKLPRFILGQTTPLEWENELKKYSSAPGYELIGNRTLITGSTKTLLEVKDPVAILERYDAISDSHDQTSGLDNSSSKHRTSRGLVQHMRETKGSYMYAFYNHTGYSQASGMPIALKLKDPWGPMHEFGHTYQQQRMTWTGQTEVTVNIYSLRSERKLGERSRLERNKVYDKMFNYFNQKDREYDKVGDLFTRLGMYWQLELAFGEEFYPKLHKLYREEAAKLNSDQEKKQYFILSASKIANTNLVPFFEKWGLEVTPESQKMLSSYPTLTHQIWELRDEMTKPMTPFSKSYSISYKGKGNKEFAALDYNRNEASANLTIFPGKPNESFGDQQYAGIKVQNKEGNALYEKTFSGNQNYDSSEEKISLTNGDFLTFSHTEAKTGEGNLTIFDNFTGRELEKQEKITYQVTNEGLVKVQNEDVPTGNITADTSLVKLPIGYPTGSSKEWKPTPEELKTWVKNVKLSGRLIDNYTVTFKDDKESTLKVDKAATGKVVMKVSSEGISTFVEVSYEFYTQTLQDKIEDLIDNNNKVKENVTQAIIDALRVQANKVAAPEKAKLIEKLNNAEQLFLNKLIKGVSLNGENRLVVSYSNDTFKKYKQIMYYADKQYLGEVANGKIYYSSYNDPLTVRVSTVATRADKYTIEVRQPHKTFVIYSEDGEKLREEVINKGLAVLLDQNGNLSKNATQAKIDEVRGIANKMTTSKKSEIIEKLNTIEQEFLNKLIKDVSLNNENKLVVSYSNDTFKNYKQIKIYADKEYLGEVADGKIYYSFYNDPLTVRNSREATKGERYTIEVKQPHKTFIIYSEDGEYLREKAMNKGLADLLDQNGNVAENVTQAKIDEVRVLAHKMTTYRKEKAIQQLDTIEQAHLNKLIKGVSLNGENKLVVSYSNDTFKNYKQIKIYADKEYLGEVADGKIYYSFYNDPLTVRNSNEATRGDRYTIEVKQPYKTFIIYSEDGEKLREEAVNKGLAVLVDQNGNLSGNATQAKIDEVRALANKMTTAKKAQMIEKLNTIEQAFLNKLIKKVSINAQNQLEVTYSNNTFKNYKQIMIYGDGKYMSEVSNGKNYYSSFIDPLTIRNGSNEKKNNYRIEVRQPHKTFVIYNGNGKS